MPVLDEQRLLAQVATGDEEALHQLYLAYRPRLRRYLWHQLGGDSASVEEALQDVFMAVWRNAKGYRAEARVSTWLYQITHYIALRSRARLDRHHGSLRFEASGNDEDDGEDWTGETYLTSDERVLDRLVLSDALRSLSPKHREVLVLIFQHGFSLDEAARILDVPAGTVKSRISYARKALWRELYSTPAKELHHDA
jgi:RNA polymerase sigma-70 factor (ECF subfamily)